jgi:peptidoglycan hydrolase-like protein with peptidoglycan-binding domain
MQYQTPSCGAHSGQSVKQVLETFRGSPEYLWKAMRLVDKLSPDVGANMATIMERLANRGICSFSILPNNANISNSDYASPATITPEMDADALNHKIGVYGFTFNPTFQQIKDAIYQHKAVILLLRVGAEWWTAENGQGSWAETDILPLKPNSQPITSRHFVTAYAFDKDYIFFINSWSDTWGRKGIGYFGSDYAYRCVEIGTTINLSAKYIFTKVLRFGMKSYDVKQLQLKLGISADGIFGNQTLTTVKTFQTTHNLMADGIVGAKTNAILNSL